MARSPAAAISARTLGAVGFATMALGLGGCDYVVDTLINICSCDPPGYQECTTDDLRCAGDVVEVCREDWCTCATWWEADEDCTPGGGVCVEPQPGYAWCVWPGPPPSGDAPTGQGEGGGTARIRTGE